MSTQSPAFAATRLLGCARPPRPPSAIRRAAPPPAPFAVLDLRAGLNVFRFTDETAWRSAWGTKRVPLRWHPAIGEYVAEGSQP